MSIHIVCALSPSSPLCLSPQPSPIDSLLLPPHISPHLLRSHCFHWPHLHLWKEYLCWTLFKWPNLNALFPATTLTSTETMRSMDMSWVGYPGRRTRLSADRSDLNFERNVNTFFFTWAGKAEHKSHLCLHIYIPPYLPGSTWRITMFTFGVLWMVDVQKMFLKHNWTVSPYTSHLSLQVSGTSSVQTLSRNTEMSPTWAK